VLPRWTAADRPVVDTDIVLWHTVGATHFCRPEDDHCHPWLRRHCEPGLVGPYRSLAGTTRPDS